MQYAFSCLIIYSYHDPTDLRLFLCWRVTGLKIIFPASLFVLTAVAAARLACKVKANLAPEVV